MFPWLKAQSMLVCHDSEANSLLFPLVWGSKHGSLMSIEPATKICSRLKAQNVTSCHASKADFLHLSVFFRDENMAN